MGRRRRRSQRHTQAAQAMAPAVDEAARPDGIRRMADVGVAFTPEQQMAIGLLRWLGRPRHAQRLILSGIKRQARHG